MPSVRFILGRAGAGKTHVCITEIAARLKESPLGPPLLLLVPDQATFQMEQALARAVPSGGFTRARVLSFNRLALAILGELGGLARPVLTPLGRQMLLRSLLMQHGEDLQLFGRSARQPGFVEKLEGALLELGQYNHSPSTLRSVVDAIEQPVLQRKLADLGQLWEAYRAALRPHHADPYEYLAMATDKGAVSSLVREAEVWIDGFAGLTPQEHRLVGMTMLSAKAVNVALCLDPNSWPQIDDEIRRTLASEMLPMLRSDPLHLFHRTEETCAHLLRTARLAQVTVLEPLLLPSRSLPRFATRELAHLESQFGTSIPKPLGGSVESVRLVAAANRRAEVEAAGREILRLSREKGYRWRDIGVITRSLEPYHDLITAVFADLGIPCFVDRRTPMAHHPVVELVRSGIEVVISRWQLRPLMQCLKTDLLPLTRDAVDALENYVLEHGIREGAWYRREPWDYGLDRNLDGVAVSPDQAQHVRRMDAARRQVVDAFSPLALLKNQEVIVRDASQAIFEFLRKSQVPDRLEKWAEESVAEGRLQEARTHQQVWDACMELLEQLTTAMGSESIAPSALARIVEAGLENLKLGLIPPAVDQVVVGAVDRSRQPHLRAAFVLGVGERAFPAISSEDSLFTDAERGAFEAAGFPLGPPAVERSLQERYLGYIAMTRAGEYLWVSYPLAGEDGRALSPSPFVAQIQAALPTVRVTDVGNDPNGSVVDAMPWLTSPRRVAAVAARILRQGGRPHEEACWRAAAALCTDDPQAMHILGALQYRYKQVPLPPDATRSLVKSPLYSSISRLESFAACPFQHFARFLLRLEPRHEHRVERTDVGLLVHETMHRFVRLLQEQGLDWSILDEAEMSGLADTLVDELAPRLRHQVFLSSARYQYLVSRVKRVLHQALWVWGKHASEGSYRPIATEVVFGGGRDQLPALVLGLPGGDQLVVRGRIDRVDVAVGTEGTYYRVVDYKASRQSLSFTDVLHGLRLQLIVYLDVVMRAAQDGTLMVERRAGPLLPGGAYYFAVKEPSLDETTPMDPEKWETELLKKMRVSGVTLASPEAVLLAERSGQGRLIPARLRKDGAVAVNVFALSQERLDLLRRTALQRMAESAAQITAGEVAARPFRYPGRTDACRFCEYHGVCHFDPQVPGYRYRTLEFCENSRAWELFEGAVSDVAATLSLGES